MPLAQLITTLASREEALALGRAAVQDRVASCAQVVGPITSVYRWQAAVEEAEEYLCLLKSPSERLERLVAFVRERHPYDTPEITAVEGIADDRYLRWARAETSDVDG